MLIVQISSIVKKMGRGSLSDIAHNTNSDVNALRGILDLLIKKGRVRRVWSQSACGSCNKCAPAQNEIYEWIES